MLDGAKLKTGKCKIVKDGGRGGEDTLRENCYVRRGVSYGLVNSARRVVKQVILFTSRTVYIKNDIHKLCRVGDYH